MALIHGISEMEQEAAQFLKRLVPRTDRATIVTLSGDLGAGKTTFVKGLAKVLGIHEHVTSPTFVIEKIYHLEGASFERLIHIDAYRLKGEHHLKVLGWDEAIQSPSSLILIEWPDHAGKAIPTDVVRIFLTYIDDDTRDIRYEY